VSSSVRNGTLTGKDVKDASLRGADLRGDSVTGQDVVESTLVLADGSVGSAQLLDESVGAVDVADDSLTAAELATDSVGNAELGPNAVSGTNVASGSLTTQDVARVSGTFVLDFPSVPANGCIGVNVDLTAFGFFDPNDPAFVMADAAWGGPVSLNVEGTGTNSFIALKGCNPTGAPVDPDGGGGSYRFVVFNA
jgi:hypothetical protein